MLSKNPMKPAFSASIMLSRNPTGSRWMSAIAGIVFEITLASRSDGKFMSRRTSVTTTSMTTPTNSMSRESGSPKRSRTRTNAPIGSSRSSSESVSQIPRKIPTTSSSVMPSVDIASSMRAAAAAITPVSASCS